MVLSLIGGLLGARSDRKNTAATNAANLEAVRRTNRLTYQENKRDRAFAFKEVRSARDWDKRQGDIAFERNVEQSERVFDRNRTEAKRAFNASTKNDRKVFKANTEHAKEMQDRDAKYQRKTEQRGREYALEDREDHRRYNDPRQARKRSEKAGINPLVGMGLDQSGGFVSGGGALGPSGPSISSGGSSAMSAAQQSVAQAVAATSGVASTVSNGYVAPNFIKANSGNIIANAFAQFADQQMAEKELAVRESQIQMEQDRFAQMMARSERQPTVPGPYGPAVGRVSNASGYVAASAAQGGDFSHTGDPEAAQKYSWMGRKGVGGTWERDETTSDAQVLEDRYGDVVSAVGGIGIMVADGWKYLNTKAKADRRKVRGAKAQEFLMRNIDPFLRPIKPQMETVPDWKKDPDAEHYDSFQDVQDGTTTQWRRRGPFSHSSAM